MALKVLVVFRKRLGEERFERLFSRIVEKAKEEGLLKERYKIVDATAIVAHVASCDVLPGNRNEGHDLPNILKQDKEKGIKAEAVSIFKNVYVRIRLE